MFSSLSDKLEATFKALRGHSKISEDNVRDAVREVKLALLEADVNFGVVRDFVKQTTEQAIGAEVIKSVNPTQQFVKIVHDQLVQVMGGQAAKFELDGGRRNVIVLLGLQGAGKTTFAGKLAKHLAKHKFHPLLVACDIYRPAAIQQLHVVGGQAGVPVFSLDGEKNVSRIAVQALKQAERDQHNLVIIDTAGRLHLDEVRMDELVALKAEVKPDYTFLVADAMTGQDAVNSASTFNGQVGIDGVCLTKLDGDTRGGAALSIRKVTEKPIVFSSIGEKLDDLEFFHPDRMASRILGMGDVVTLVEKAQGALDEADALQAASMQKKLKTGRWTFDDFLKQMEMLKKIGSFQSILKMIPGVGNLLKDADFDEKELFRIRGMIQSMTPKERNDPDILNGSRRLRIAKGSGSTVQEVNQLVRQFEEMRKLMKNMLGGGGGRGMMGRMLPGMAGAGRGGGALPGSGGGGSNFTPKSKKKKKKLKSKRR